MYKDINWRKNSANKTNKDKKLQFFIIVIILINNVA